MRMALYSTSKLAARMGIVVVAFLWATTSWAQIAPAGTVIGNQATATYQTPSGESVQVLSNLVETVVNQVAAVDLDPAYDDQQAGGPADTLLGPKTISVTGGTVTFPHTIENLGNAPDSFRLSFAASSILTNVRILPDADGNGVADSITPLADGSSPTGDTPILSPGDTFGIIVLADISAADAATVFGGGPDPVEAGQPITVTAESVAGITDASVAGASDAVNDDVSVSDGAVITTTKTMSPETASPGATVTVTLAYENTGNAAGTVRIKDPLPTQLVYNANSASWSAASGGLVDGGGADTAVAGDVDLTSGTGSQIAYVVDTPANLAVDDEGTGASQVILFEVSNVPPGTAGEVTFTVQIASGTQSGSYRNGIYACVDDGSNCDPDEPGPQTPFDVDPVYGLTLADSQSTADTPAAGAGQPDAYGDAGQLGGALAARDEGATNDDISRVLNGNVGAPTPLNPSAPFSAGGEVRFEFVLTNDGTVSDRFDLTHEIYTDTLGDPGRPSAAGARFPTGTAFSFESGAGAVLSDTNGNSAPDVTLGANEARTIVLVAELPFNASRAAGAPSWFHTVVATSAGDSDFVNVSVAEMAAEVVAVSVDLSNDAGVSGDGSAATPAGTAGALQVGDSGDDDISQNGTVAGDPWTTAIADPGETVTFNLQVANTSQSAQTFLIDFTGTPPSDGADADSVSGTPGSAGEFDAGAGLAGYTVQFFVNDAATNNTGAIAAGGTQTVRVDITVPATAAASDADIFFRATSAAGTGVFDVKKDRIQISENADLSLSPDRTGQASPGGAVVFAHRIANEGNICVADGPAPVFSAGFPSFAAELYFDVNDDGLLDGGDLLITGTANGIAEFITAALAASAGNLGDGQFNAGDRFTILSRVQVPPAAVDGASEVAILSIDDAAGSLTLCAGSSNAGSGSTANNNASEQASIVSGDLEILKEQALDADCNGTPDGGVYQLNQLQATPTQCVIYRITVTNSGTANADNVRIVDETPAFTTYEDVIAVAVERNDGAGFTVVNANPSTEPAQGTTGAIASQGQINTLQPGQVARMTFAVEIEGNQTNSGAGPTPLQ